MNRSFLDYSLQYCAQLLFFEAIHFTPLGKMVEVTQKLK